MKRSRVALTLTALLVVACSGDQIVGPRHGPGAIELRLTVPHAGSGALFVTIHGGAIDSITSPELNFATLETAAAEYGVLVRGQLHNDAVVRLWVPDRTTRYTATIEQATDGYQRAETSGYALSVPSTR